MTHGGLSGSFEKWETARGERRITVGGVDGSDEIFDGTRGWLVDRNHHVRALAGTEVTEELAFSGLLKNVTQGKKLTITRDAQNRIATIARQEAEKVRTMKLSDYRTVNGVDVPYAIEDGTGDPADTLVVKIDKVEVDATPPPFVRPPDPKPDWTLAPNTVLPIEMYRNLPTTEVTINGKPGTFIIDTGAEVTVINMSRVAGLGLKTVGAGSIGGGGGDIGFAYIQDVGMTMPGVELQHQTVAAVPLDAMEPLFGHPIDGILGYDFLSRFVVEIDYANKKMTLHDPATFQATGAGVPITLEDSTAHADAKIAAGTLALTGHFTVDTGYAGEVSLNAPFVVANDLLKAVPNTIEPPAGSAMGVGGETKSVVGRLASVEIGGLTVARPITDFGKDAVGAGADAETQGLLGSDLWKRFVVTFDYTHEKMYLVPGPKFADANDAIGTGIMWVEAAPHTIVCAGLMPKSPGVDAGLQAGDVLVTLDGKSGVTVKDAELGELKTGDKHTFVVKRGDKQITAVVTARAIL
ncbi:MAG: aspartyl protease family protein [Kofleriaceae bacterium]